MDVILHVGAHRTATTSFQHYMRRMADTLGVEKVGFWGPSLTRKSVLAGFFQNADFGQRCQIDQRVKGRIKLRTAQLEQGKVQHLVVSDENMIGTCAQNIQIGALYPAIGERMARVSAAFDGRISRVVISLRAQDLWWASAAAMTAARGHRLLDGAKCKAIAQNPRSWRDVITDLACAVPGADICVLPFEKIVGQPDKLLSAMLDRQVPRDTQHHWLNRSADLVRMRQIIEENGGDPSSLPNGAGRWQPFTSPQCAAMRETYSDDLHWLTAGADGLARLTENKTPKRAGMSLPKGQKIKGQDYDQGYANPQGQLAQPR